MAQTQVKIIKPYTDKEMGKVHIPEGVIMTFDNKKAKLLIKKGIAEKLQDVPEPREPKNE